MAGDLEDSIRKLLSEGYSPDEIQEELREEGYRESVIDNAIANVTGRRVNPENSRSESGGMGKSRHIQQYGWITVYLLILAAYISLAWRPRYIYQHVARSLPLTGFEAIVGLILLSQIGVGGYRFLSGQRKRGAIVAVTAVAAVVAFGMVLSRGIFSPVSTGEIVSVSAVDIRLSVMPWILNAGVLIVAIGAAAASWRNIGKKALVFPFFFLLIFGGTWGVQYLEITEAATEIEPPDMTMDTDTVIQEGDGPELLQAAATNPPPFTRLSVWEAGIAQSASLFLRWRGMKSEAASQGVMNPALTAPGEICGGTAVNIQDEFGERSLVWPIHYGQTIIAEMKESKAAGVAALQLACESSRECTASRSEISTDFESYIQWREKELSQFQQLLGIQPISTENFRVDDCSPPPESYYGLRMTNISCTSSPTVTLQQTGSRIIQSDLRLLVSNNKSHLTATYDIGRIREARHTYTAQDPVASPKFSFKEGMPYKVEVETGVGMTVSAYCVGGNGFCSDCHREEVETELGNVSRLVRD